MYFALLSIRCHILCIGIQLIKLIELDPLSQWASCREANSWQSMLIVGILIGSQAVPAIDIFEIVEQTMIHSPSFALDIDNFFCLFILRSMLRLAQ